MEDADTVLNLGTSGTGKSHILGADIEEWHEDPDHEFTLIVDKKNDHQGLSAQMGFEKYEIRASMIDSDKFDRDFWIEFLESAVYAGKPGARITFTKRDYPTKSQFRKLGDMLADACFIADVNCGLVIEEISNFAPSECGEAEIENLETYISECRSEDKKFGATTQYPQKLHYLIRKAPNKIRCFYLGQDERDYKKVTSRRFYQKMMEWSEEEIKEKHRYLFQDQNIGLIEFRDAGYVDRKTVHSG